MPLTAADKTRASMGGMLGEGRRKGNAVYAPAAERVSSLRRRDDTFQVGGEYLIKPSALAREGPCAQIYPS